MFSNHCRLCVQEVDIESCKKLFEKRSLKLLQDIKNLTGVLLEDLPSMPCHICNSCEKELHQSLVFRQQCLDAQEYLAQEGVKNEEFTEVEAIEDFEDAEDNLETVNIMMHDDLDADLIKDLKSEDLDYVLVPENDSSGSSKSLNTHDEYLEVDSDIDSIPASIHDYEDDENVERVIETGTIVIMPSNSSDGTRISSTVTSKKVSKLVLKEKRPKGRPRKDGLPNKAARGSDSKDAAKKSAEERARVQINICDQCGNRVIGRHAFEQHLRRHFGVKDYHCEICSNSFCTHSELKRHMRKHTGERPFACAHCERRFTDYSTRVKHERTHTNERPYICSQCNKAFTTAYILKNHMLVHTGERSYRCEPCNKSFQRQTHLATHFRSIVHKQSLDKQSTMTSREYDS